MVTVTAAERGRAVRQRLLQAAAELIASRGWTAVSTRVLAERAGVAPGVVHYHFSSVQALLTEAALAVLRQMLDDAGALLRRARTPDETLELLLGVLEGHDGTDTTSLLFIETYLAATRDGALREALAGIVVEFRERLAEHLTTLHVPEPEHAATVLAATIDGLVLHRALSPGLSAAQLTLVLGRLLTPHNTN